MAAAQPPSVPAGVERSVDAETLQQLNLQTVRERIMELEGTMQRMLATFQQNYALRWSDVLSQYSVVNIQLFKLMEDMKPILKMFVVYPWQVNAENSQILPIMLSSKLLPEMEAQDALQKESALSALQMPPGAQVEKLQKQMEALKSACEWAEKEILEGKKVMVAGSRGAAAAATGQHADKAHLARMVEQEKSLRGGLLMGEGLRPSPEESIPTQLPPHLAHLQQALIPATAQPAAEAAGKPVMSRLGGAGALSARSPGIPSPSMPAAQPSFASPSPGSHRSPLGPGAAAGMAAAPSGMRPPSMMHGLIGGVGSPMKPMSTPSPQNNRPGNAAAVSAMSLQQQQQQQQQVRDWVSQQQKPNHIRR